MTRRQVRKKFPTTWTVILLFDRTAMHCRPGITALICSIKNALEVFCHLRSVVICASKFHSARHAPRNYFDHSAQNIDRLIRMRQEMSASIVRTDFLHRTCEIHIDNIVAHLDDDVRGARHLVCLRSHDLTGKRMIIDRRSNVVSDFAHPTFGGDQIWVLANFSFASIEQRSIKQRLCHAEWTAVPSRNQSHCTVGISRKPSLKERRVESWQECLHSRINPHQFRSFCR